jgi:uncharacterized protein YktB (UPF0637 family)
MIIFATGCCVLMLMYWTTLLAVLFYTRNSYPNSNVNESMKDFEKKLTNINEQVEPENVSNSTNHTETETETETEIRDAEMLDTVMESETKKEN